MSRPHVAGAVAGGLVAGLAITAMLIAGERNSGTASELTQLERVSAEKLKLATPLPGALPSAREQALVQGGHLALSALAGAAYAATVDEDAPIVASGIGFGLAFYALAHWIAGPLLGVKAPEWTSARKVIAMHTLNHIGFGLLTALGAHASRIRKEIAQ
ncbi:hypothetical protein [Novosphingobium terrae]|uniref:hypothetical protein n=1 Tax=Novosphingobium terrae TaxID=2726189 RepID=UPI00198129E0|nr:hypothetical protein [Novosphingobium terrae]